MSITELDSRYVAGTYKRFPIEIVSGHGSVAFSSDGREYIDMGSGIGVTSFGIADEKWVEAVTAQLGRVQHMSNLYYTEPCAELARRLCEQTGMKKVFFGNSGAEANECAIKVARKYAAGRHGEDCYTIVTLKNSFHGRTLTTLSATGQDAFHKLYQPLTPGFCHVTAGEIGELYALAGVKKIAGIMIECVQGEGGVIALDADYARAVADFAAKNDIVLIVDEVQTGGGRTGEFYSYMHYGIKPDVVTTAKGLGGGLPIGAAIMGERVADVLGYGDHGSTFGGNPVSCAGAISIVDRVDGELLAEVRRKGEYIRSELTGAPGIESVTGLGMMVGIKTARPAADVVADCIARGVLCLTAKDKVRLLPALNIPDGVLRRAVSVIKSACAGEEK